MATKKNSEKNSKANDTVATVIKTAVDRALKKDNVSNSNGLRIDAQAKGIALMTARTYCASSINGELLTKVSALDRKSVNFTKGNYVVKCMGNKGACFAMASGVSDDGAFALFADGSIIAFGVYGQLTIDNAGAMDRFIANVRKGEHFATGQTVCIVDGKEAGELDGVIVGTKDVTTAQYYGIISRHGDKFAVTTLERKANAYNKGIGALSATVKVLDDKATAKLLAIGKKK